MRSTSPHLHGRRVVAHQPHERALDLGLRDEDVRRHRAHDLGGGVVRDLHRHRAVRARRPTPAASRSPTSRCTITSNALDHRRRFQRVASRPVSRRCTEGSPPSPTGSPSPSRARSSRRCSASSLHDLDVACRPTTSLERRRRAGDRARPRTRARPRRPAQRVSDPSPGRPRRRDHPAARREPHDPAGGVGVGEEVLAERLATAGPRGGSRSSLDLARRHRSTPNTRAGVRRVDLGDLLRLDTPCRARARRRPSTTNAGSLGLPRYGSGREERLIGLDEDAIGGRERAASRSVVRLLERDDAAERQVAAAIERRPRFVGTTGEAVEDRALGDALVVEDTERVVPRVAGVDHERLPGAASRAGSGTGRRSPARRAASARSRDRTRTRRSRRTASDTASGSSRPHSDGELRRVVRVQTRPSRTRRGAGRRASSGLLRRLEIGPDADHPLDARGTRARSAWSSAASRAAGGNGSRPTRVLTRLLAREQRLTLFQLRTRRAAGPIAAAGQPLILGPARQAEAAPQLGRGIGDHRRREQRDDAQRLRDSRPALARPLRHRPAC